MSRAVSLGLHSYRQGRQLFDGTPLEAFAVASYVLATTDGLTDAERGEALRAVAEARLADEPQVSALEATR